MTRFMVHRVWLPVPSLLALIATFFAANVQADQPAPLPQLVSASAESSQDILWHEDFQLGWSEAKRLGRPMLIFITSGRCHYCDAMKRDTWCNGGVLQRVKQHYVAIRLTPDRNASVLNRINVPAYPTTLIGHPDGHIVAHKIGYQPPGEMQLLLQSFGQSDH
ncbi:thioredoxin family protein [Stieleria sp. TO1_6]|uniref:thioredoxin family protein n=1 Tax=Stieleria tagensis TaxID=2956795 RepID=UPI00209BAF89|nr:thioredoxin family protein [Stieleria tagensis]MCO8122994.1 thioredoxin family protein [Stieleria tagensis]